MLRVLAPLFGFAALAVFVGLAARSAEPSAAPAAAADASDAAPEKRPALVVENRTKKMDGYPCSECHDESMQPDPRERELTESHDDIKLVHGAGRFWCTTCHGATSDKNNLVSLKGTPISFDEQYVLCAQCHADKVKAFEHGAHGKRLESWRGERKVAACTSCHDAHDPAIKPRKPWRGPDATR